MRAAQALPHLRLEGRDRDDGRQNRARQRRAHVQVANGNDFWFHVRDYPGSHVVIRARDQLPEETLLDAATLAVHFSRGKAGGKRDVSWTRRKFVAKARGAPAGQVLLSTHKTIHLRVEPDRLARLLAPRSGSV